MAWRKVGTVSLSFTDMEVPVGPVQLDPSGTLEVRIKQTSPVRSSIFRAGRFYVRTGSGRTLGTRKFWGHLEGEDYVLGGPGFSAQASTGILWIEPGWLNRQALKAPNWGPWVLEVSADEKGPLPADRVTAPGFVNSIAKLLLLKKVGSQGRITF